MKNNLRGTKGRLPRFALESGERGQAIVLIALMLVLLLGMTAIAIDGGGLLFLQRDAQNAADAGVIVGAFALCNDRETEAGTLAIQGAGENGFTDGGTQANAKNIDVTTFCNYNTTGSPHAGSCDGALTTDMIPAELAAQVDDYIRVQITAEKPAYFAQLVYSGPLNVTVDAVAQCSPPHGPGSVPAIRGLRACGVCGTGNHNDSVDFSGSEAHVTGGTQSNCNCKINGSIGNPSTVDDGTTCTGTMASNGVTFDPPAETNQPPNSDDPLAEIYPLSAFQSPDGFYYKLAAADTCGAALGKGAAGTTTGCYHIGAASTFDGNMGNSPGTNTFEGIYYFTSGDWAPNGNIYVGPKGATFISPSGVINFTKMEDPWPYQNGGFLFAASYKNDTCGTVIQGPNSKSGFNGIMYGPFGECSWSMATSYTAYGAIICQKVDISGSEFELHFDPLMLPRIPGSTSANQ